MKKVSNIRLTCTYQRLNDATIIPVLPLPATDELLHSLGGSTVFSVLNLAGGFFQATIEPDGIPLTAVCTPTGLHEWLRVPMGTRGSPGRFQRRMTQVCVKACNAYSHASMTLWCTVNLLRTTSLIYVDF